MRLICYHDVPSQSTGVLHSGAISPWDYILWWCHCGGHSVVIQCTPVVWPRHFAQHNNNINNNNNNNNNINITHNPALRLNNDTPRRNSMGLSVIRRTSDPLYGTLASRRKR